MYSLYYLPGACSLATQVVLRELDQRFELINKQDLDNFAAINPVGAVPVLVDGDQTLKEGAAILLYLLEKHPNRLLPEAPAARQKAIENILFANATMHPAYGRLFFIDQAIGDASARQAAFDAAAKAISALWQSVDQQLEQQPFLGGDTPSAADIMLSVYYRWGGAFPIDIVVSERVSRMTAAVMAMPSFVQALAAEQQ